MIMSKLEKWNICCNVHLFIYLSKVITVSSRNWVPLNFMFTVTQCYVRTRKLIQSYHIPYLFSGWKIRGPSWPEKKGIWESRRNALVTAAVSTTKFSFDARLCPSCDPNKILETSPDYFLCDNFWDILLATTIFFTPLIYTRNLK